MYSTCLFCNRSLGRNEAVEHFPVGRRLAFDAAKGRLWAVCARCGRWNLTPLDERWEAIEECERLFARTASRVSTGTMGLARLADGTELVRVGERTARPELAAWRYGRHFISRRRQTTAAAVPLATVALVGLTAAGGPVMGFVAGVSLVAAAAMAAGTLPSTVKVAALEAPDGSEHPLRGSAVKGARLRAREARWELEVQTGRRVLRFAGEDARRALGALLPALNFAGGREAEVTSAVQSIERAGGATDYFAAAASDPASYGIRGAAFGPRLAALPREVRLAMEMAAHEERERRALEGELAVLEAEWRRAEEIAAIADDLFLPASVRDWMARLKR